MILTRHHGLRGVAAAEVAQRGDDDIDPGHDDLGTRA